MPANWDQQSIARIVRSVLKTERLIPSKDFAGEQYRGLGTFGVIRGRIKDTFSTGSHTFVLEDVVALGQDSPFPGSEVTIVNVPKSSGTASGTAYAIWNYAAEYPTGTSTGKATGAGTGEGNWELFQLTSVSGVSGALGCIIKDVPAASYTVSGTGTALSLSLTHGSSDSAAIILVVSGQGWQPELVGPSGSEEIRILTCVNLSKTVLRASQTHPVILSGFIEFLDSGTEGGTGTELPEPTLVEVFVPDNWDLRALPEFDLNYSQIPFHAEGENGFQLGGEPCGTGTGTGT